MLNEYTSTYRMKELGLDKYIENAYENVPGKPVEKIEAQRKCERDAKDPIA